MIPPSGESSAVLSNWRGCCPLPILGEKCVEMREWLSFLLMIKTARAELDCKEY